MTESLLVFFFFFNETNSLAYFKMTEMVFGLICIKKTVKYNTLRMST